MKTKFLLLLAAGILFYGLSMQAQTTVTIQPVQDNTLYEHATESLSNGAGNHLFVGLTNQGLIRRGLLKFDIASIVPTGATILEATLTLSMDKTISGPANIELHTLNTDWGEGASVAVETAGSSGGIGATAQSDDATWLHSFYDSSTWNTAGGDFNATASATTSVDGLGSYSWTSTQLTADVQNWLDVPANNFGWCLTGDEVTVKTAKRFASREIATAANRPSLTIVYNTVPVSVQQTKAGSRLTIYPNPSSGKMQLTVSDVPMAKVQIYNVVGLPVYSQSIIDDRPSKIDLSKEPSGLYFYKLLSNNRIVETGKITIMKSLAP